MRKRKGADFKRMVFTFLISCFTLALFPDAVAQPRMETFLFPDKHRPNEWRLDVYFKLQRDWLSQLGRPERPQQARAIVAVLNSQKEVLAEKVVAVNISRANERMLEENHSSVQQHASFHLKSGNYRVVFELQLEREKTLFAATKKVQVGERNGRVDLSDLVPVRFPKLAEPPFSELFWVEDEPHALNFLLYYEVHTAAPDTLIHLHSVIENQQGGALRQETYALSVDRNMKHDFLRVDLDALPWGTYLVHLKVQGSAPLQQRTFEFSTGGGSLGVKENPQQSSTL
ncbi:MAG: hypothetical protein ACE5HS_03750 [bacterium]